MSSRIEESCIFDVGTTNLCEENDYCVPKCRPSLSLIRDYEYFVV